MRFEDFFKKCKAQVFVSFQIPSYSHSLFWRTSCLRDHFSSEKKKRTKGIFSTLPPTFLRRVKNPGCGPSLDFLVLRIISSCHAHLNPSPLLHQVWPTQRQPSFSNCQLCVCGRLPGRYFASQYFTIISANVWRYVFVFLICRIFLSFL